MKNDTTTNTYAGVLGGGGGGGGGRKLDYFPAAALGAGFDVVVAQGGQGGRGQYTAQSPNNAGYSGLLVQYRVVQQSRLCEQAAVRQATHLQAPRRATFRPSQRRHGAVGRRHGW